MDRAEVEAWVAGYERAWRTAGTEELVHLFTADASYLVSPWARPIEGIGDLAELWETGRDGPGETFTMTSEVVAVDGRTAVVRVEVDYGRGSRWKDLWVLQFDNEGRCRSFEEWPFAPRQKDGH